MILLKVLQILLGMARQYTFKMYHSYLYLYILIKIWTYVLSGKYILDYTEYSLQVSNKGYRFSNKVLEVHLYFSLIIKKLLGTIVRRYQVILFNK